MTLIELTQLLRKRIWLIVALPLAFALFFAGYAFLMLPNTYTASTSMYVLANSISDASGEASANLSASQMLTNDVAQLIQSERVRRDTAQAVGLDSLSEYSISVSSSTNTRVITLYVSGEDAQSCAAIANGLAQSVSEVAQEVMEVQSVNVIDAAEIPARPSGPRRSMYVLMGALSGLFVALALVLVLDLLNTRVRDVDEVQELIGVPVIGRVPTVGERR